MAESLKHLDQAVEADVRASQLGDEFDTRRRTEPGFMADKEAYDMAGERNDAASERDANLWRGALAEGSVEAPKEELEYNVSEPKRRDYLAAGANILLRLQSERPLTEEEKRELDATLWRIEEADSAGDAKAA